MTLISCFLASRMDAPLGAARETVPRLLVFGCSVSAVRRSPWGPVDPVANPAEARVVYTSLPALCVSAQQASSGGGSRLEIVGDPAPLSLVNSCRRGLDDEGIRRKCLIWWCDAMWRCFA